MFLQQTQLWETKIRYDEYCNCILCVSVTQTVPCTACWPNGKENISLVYTHSFNVDYKTSKSITYIIHSRQLIPNKIHLIPWTKFERREKPDLSVYVER